MNQNKIHIWEDPESRIQFLETVLKDGDWQAVIHAPPMQKASLTGQPHSLAPLKQELDAKGYTTTLGLDEHQQEMLTIRHIGSDADMLVNLKHFGMVKGMRRTLENMPNTLGHLLHKTWEGIQYAGKDSARLLSAIYLFGDIAYTMTGLFEGKGKAGAETASAGEKGNILKRTAVAFGQKLTNFNDLPNGLMSLSGIFAVAQSLIFLEFARDGSELHLEALKKQMDGSIAKGKDPLDSLINEKREEDQQGVVSGIHRLLMRHPIETGATAQILGQISLFAASGLRLKGGKIPADSTRESFRKGEMLNMGRSATSIAGWMSLMHTPKEVGEKSPWSDPQRLIQEYNQHPERFASGINFGASALGLWSSQHRGNLAQKVAESTWLVGDIVMAFVEKGNYGKEGEKGENMAGEAAAQFLQHAPIAYSASAGERLYKEIARYIARRTVEVNASTPPAGANEMLFEKEREKAIDDMGDRITKCIMKAMAGKFHRYAVITHHAAMVADLFPEAERPQVITALSKAIADIPGVYATPEETADEIKTTHAAITRSSQGGAPSSPPGMATLAPSVSELIYCLPGMNLGPSANAIYDALKPFSRSTPADETILARSMTHQAGQALGLGHREAEKLLQESRGQEHIVS